MLLLYRACRCWSYADELPLHSTMLLLYQLLLLFFCHSRNLYIPLCFYYIHLQKLRTLPYISFTFHYASTISKCVLLISCYIPLLYIPLCFYYIYVGRYSNHLYSIFTFHYASTISMLLCFLTCLHCFFTFHYASTISLRRTGLTGQVLSLHSTMLLLYRR